MRLNDDLSIKLLSKSWREIESKKLIACCMPFVSAIGKNSLLIYGGLDEELSLCLINGANNIYGGLNEENRLIIDMD